MYSKIVFLGSFLFGIFVFIGSSFAFDLTGDWQCNDGGTYYLRQDGRDIWWYGEKNHTNTPWSNVANGDIVGNQLHLNWVDVPKGRAGGGGFMILEILDQGRRLRALKKENGFGGSSWVKRNSGF
jgi:hypothetical protein